MRERKTKRIALSKSARFAIFERDKFTCQYCGKTPPEVQLHCDHILPVVEGGTNEKENLRTSCLDCNLGKGSKILYSQTGNPLEQLRKAQESLEDMQVAREFAEAKAARDELRQTVCNYLCELLFQDKIGARNLTSVIKKINEHGSGLVMEWLDIAICRCGIFSEDKVMRYFHGIARNYREQMEDEVDND
jgi:hypothetical protein